MPNTENTENTFLSDFPSYENPEVTDLKDKLNDLSSQVMDIIDRHSLKNSFMLAVFEYAKNCTGDNEYQRNINNLEIIFHKL